MSLLRAGLSVALGLSRVGRTALHAHAAYTLGVWALSHLYRDSPPEPGTAQRMAVLVVAHDEASVIAGCVRSLCEQRYSRDAFEVFVVADNCSDDTAAKAREAPVLLPATGGR